ncbi:MAG: cytochrome c3 family protein [Polyangiaceae bacterium]|nr:cytochrome c3 family protein [Polyangiaceae bacterium]
MPAQPVPFSHAQHVGQLGMDCRYCHLFVDRAAHASIPTTESCMNCHRAIWATSPKLLLVRESLTTGKSIEWWRVHDLPDYAYFDHSAHVARGVGCVSCHGRVDQMAEVWQDLSLSMSFCLACHRSPEQHLRPPDQVTSMDWQAPNGDPIAHGMVLRDRAGINPSTDCSTCHR